MLFGFRIKFDHLLLYAGFFITLGASVWKGKKITLPLMQTSLPVKLIMLLSVAIVSFFLARKFGDWFSRFLQLIQERITPLVWLFGTIVFLSIPIVSYHTWFKVTEKVKLEKIAASSESGKDRPNIILLTFDALTARDMSVYGYHRQTTPFITEWAKSASLFTGVKAAGTMTTSTTASLMTGKRVWSHQTYHQASAIQNKSYENFVIELRKNGYHTMAYIENWNASPEGLGIPESFDYMSVKFDHGDFLNDIHSTLFLLFQGKIRLYDWMQLEDFFPNVLFQHYIYYPVLMPIYDRLFPETNNAFNKGVTLLDKFISDIDKNAPPEPFFVWIHLLRPHAPYVPPKSFQGTFEPSQRLRGAREQTITMKRINENENKGLTVSDLQDMETLRARYDEHILFCDREFNDFIDNLEKRNLLGNSVIIVSADHGESFEHNQLAHANTLYEQVVSIPLIIKEPNQREGKVFHDIIEQIDISSTIMDFSGVPVSSWLEGRSLWPLIRGKEFPPRPAFTMYFQSNPSRQQKITKGVIVVHEGDYKLIYYLEEKRSLLFNLKEDPDEMNDLFNKESEIGQRLLDLINDNLEKANEIIGSDVNAENK
jgi:arylsulfatase A-like enzyme